MLKSKVLALAMVVLPGLSVNAAGPQGCPVWENTVKASTGVPRDLFDRQMPLIEQRRADWLKGAEVAKPRLIERTVRPARLVRPKGDPAAFLGWRFEDDGATEKAFGKPLSPGDVIYLDFGEHLTGYFSVGLGRFDEPVDAPVRLRLTFGEVPAELLLPFSRECGISTSWWQEEVLTVDDVPSVVEVPRRLSFRYVKVLVDGCSPNGRFCLKDAAVRAQTSADEKRLVPYSGSQADAALDVVANRTLRECMQTVLEDGPKRDRRLWLGDLRLQALANYETYRNLDVVKRSILVLAGTCAANGLVSTAAYERPFVERANVAILDYTALFANVVEEYLVASGDRATCESLWPLVLKQADFTLATVGADGLVQEDLTWWQFIDWQPQMKHQAAEQAVIVCSLRALERLGKAIGHEKEVAFVPAVVAKMTAVAQDRLWDKARGLWVSNGDNVSWMSQAWMALSGIATQEQACRSLTGVVGATDAICPVTPYAHHYFTEALFTAGLRNEALAHLRDYWGGMIRVGADTFWEVWVSDDPAKSPYGNVQINSFCHAWSCTAGYLLRKYAEGSRSLSLAGDRSNCRRCDKDESWLLQTNLLETSMAKASSALPNVLILGDSISLGYTPIVKRLLKDEANVSRPACNCGSSQYYLKNMKTWVGTNRWSVIHVNFGIWDNHYLKGSSDGRDLFWGRELTNSVPSIAKGTAIRDLGFRIRTPITEYELNLRTILGYLKEHADEVVFGLTTPVTAWETDDRCGRIRVYNELATAVCAELDVAVDGLYAVAERNLDKQTDGCHFNTKGYEVLAEAVVRSIRQSFGKRRSSRNAGKSKW